MKRVGIIRCQQYAERCSAANCFVAAKNGQAHFQKPSEIVAMDTCGGCPRGTSDKVLARAKRIQSAGADTVHLSNCMVGPCPWVDQWETAIRDELGMTVVRGTH